MKYSQSRIKLKKSWFTFDSIFFCLFVFLATKTNFYLQFAIVSLLLFYFVTSCVFTICLSFYQIRFDFIPHHFYFYISSEFLNILLPYSVFSISSSIVFCSSLFKLLFPSLLPSAFFVIFRHVLIARAGSSIKTKGCNYKERVSTNGEWTSTNSGGQGWEWVQIRERWFML